MAAVRSLVLSSTIPLTIAIPITPTPTAPAPPADPDIVFCLSAPQRGQLADAAVSLKVAKAAAHPGDVVVNIAGNDTEISVERWRELRPGDFGRACTALARAPKPAATAAPSGNGGDVASTVTGLIPVAFGALLAGATAAFSGWWKDRTTTRRALAADLTAAMRVLRASTERFLASGEVPADQVPARAALQQAWADAVGAVRRVTIAYPRRPQPAELERLVTDSDLQHDMSLRWHVSTEERVARATRLRAAVDRMELLATRITAALQRRIGPFPLRLADPKAARSDKAATK